MGPFYSTEDLPHYCYAIYSKWGQPDKERTLIPKGATLHFHFLVNTTSKAYTDDSDEVPKPMYSLPGSPSVQIAVHSPYFLPSPYLDGMSYLGGRAYELTLTMSERHLLPAPYQTNCTDYMTLWRERGGKAPINQKGVVEECRLNRTNELYGCVPVTLDYPHNYVLCQTCETCNYTTFTKECGALADDYTQPCDSITYNAVRENKVITTSEEILSSLLNFREVIHKRIPQHDCDGNKIFRKECATIEVDVLFDRFEITNLTYNAKFESLELFSVIGGYMGMWLGISLLNVYDFIGTFMGMARDRRRKKKEQKKLKMSKKDRFYPQDKENLNPGGRYNDKMDDYRRPRRIEVW